MRFTNIITHYCPLFALIVILSVGGCVSQKKRDIIMPEVATEWSNEKQKMFSTTESTINPRWWEDFNDPALSILVEKAYTQNLTLQGASLRILQARALLDVARSELYPVLNAKNSISYTKPSGNAQPSDKAFSHYQLGLDSSWEIDLWGRTKENIAAARAEVKTRNMAYEDIALSLAAEVSSAYINYAIIHNQIQLINANIGLQKQSLHIAKALFKEGSRTALDVQQAQAILAATQALLPDLERNKFQIRNALITLLALPPNEIDLLLPTKDISLPILEKDIAIGVPLDTLRRRPDIRQAEWTAAAAAAQAQAAHLARYPRITLSGTINLQVTDGVPTLFDGGPEEIFSKNSLGFTIGPSISIPLFTAKRLKNNALAKDATFQQALTAYRLAVFRGMQDVENSLTALAQSQQRYNHLSKSVEAYNQAYTIAKILYNEGEGSFQNVIDTQRQLINQQQAQVAEQGNISLAQISLIRALGGGWIPDESTGEGNNTEF